MSKGLRWYYVVRALIVLAWVAVMLLLKARREMVVFGALFIAAFYAWLPRSGRYVVQADSPLSPLRRDEREQTIGLRATAYGFVAVTMLLAAAVLGAAAFGRDSLSVELVSTILAVGMIARFAADFWLRRRM